MKPVNRRGLIISSLLFFVWIYFCAASLFRVRMPSGRLRRISLNDNMTVTDLHIVAQQCLLEHETESNVNDGGVSDRTNVIIDGNIYDESNSAFNSTKISDLHCKPGDIIATLCRRSAARTNTNDTELEINYSQRVKLTRSSRLIATSLRKHRHGDGHSRDLSNMLSERSSLLRVLKPEDSRPLRPITTATLASLSVAQALHRISTQGGVAILFGTATQRRACVGDIEREHGHESDGGKNNDASSSIRYDVEVHAAVEVTVFDKEATGYSDAHTLHRLPLSDIVCSSSSNSGNSSLRNSMIAGLQIVGIAVGPGPLAPECVWSPFHLYSALQLRNELYYNSCSNINNHSKSYSNSSNESHTAATYSASIGKDEDENPLLILSVTNKPKGSKIKLGGEGTHLPKGRRPKPTPLLVDDSLLMETHQLNEHAAFLINASLLTVTPYSRLKSAVNFDSRPGLTRAWEARPIKKKTGAASTSSFPSLWISRDRSNIKQQFKDLHEWCIPNGLIHLPSKVLVRSQETNSLASLLFASPVPLVWNSNSKPGDENRYGKHNMEKEGQRWHSIFPGALERQQSGSDQRIGRQTMTYAVNLLENMISSASSRATACSDSFNCMNPASSGGVIDDGSGSSSSGGRDDDDNKQQGLSQRVRDINFLLFLKSMVTDKCFVKICDYIVAYFGVPAPFSRVSVSAVNTSLSNVSVAVLDRDALQALRMVRDSLKSIVSAASDTTSNPYYEDDSDSE